MRPDQARPALEIGGVDLLGFQVCLVTGWHVFRYGGVPVRVFPRMRGDALEVHPHLHRLGVEHDLGLPSDVFVGDAVEVGLVHLEVVGRVDGDLLLVFEQEPSRRKGKKIRLLFLLELLPAGKGFVLSLLGVVLAVQFVQAAVQFLEGKECLTAQAAVVVPVRLVYKPFCGPLVARFGRPAFVQFRPVMEAPLAGRLVQRRLVPVGLLDPLPHVVGLRYLGHAAEVFHGPGQRLEQVFHPRARKGGHVAEHRVREQAYEDCRRNGLSRRPVDNPELVSGEVELHLAARLIDVVILVVVVLLVFLEDGLELRVAVGIARRLLIVHVQNLIGHVLPFHLQGILLGVLHQERVAVFVPPAVPVALDEDGVQLGIAQGQKIRHASTGRFGTVPIGTERGPADAQLPLDLP